MGQQQQQQQQADGRLCTLLCFCTLRCLLQVIKQPLMARQEKKREEGSCVLHSIRLCWLLLFFHDTSECLYQSREFIQRELHTWAPAKSWSCGIRSVFICVHVLGCNPSEICFLLPFHECRDFSSISIKASIGRHHH